ncbi:hypothetical protein [Enterobacter kobei]|uniref:hypothetical protein n=1 Tax=Enterobacter kobei TaxID=208224 RepID=UPI001F516B09|nr:hypothetical protein [Enterobacter kobei]MCH4289169.1 hypothetical protein [Enterobacter kobei]
MLTQVTTIAAAIIVGLWGYYSTIYIKKEKEITEYTLKEFKQKTTQTSHIQARVESIVHISDGGSKLLEIKIILSNQGNKQSRVTLDDDSLSLIPVEFSNGKPLFQEPINLHSGRYAGNVKRIPLNFVDIGAGENYEFTFIYNIDSTGVYLIHFLALNGTIPSEKELSKIDGIPFKYSIGADEYIFIK